MDTIRVIADRLKDHVDRERLVATAKALVEAPSPTGEAGPAADRLGRILADDGFRVERPLADHPASPAVAVRYSSGQPGPTLQFNGHLDVVHLPFVPPEVRDGRLTGSGACDMKGGTAAAVEALRALRDANALSAGSVLLTAHDTHEAPWGFGKQLEALIAGGYVGDAVLLPEPLSDRLPMIGRGQACWKIKISRNGPPVHEVMRPTDEPSVIAAGAEFVGKLAKLDAELATQADPLAGAPSVFVGQIHSGEIYNQFPQECWLEGTRRWLPGTDASEVERAFRALVGEVERSTRTKIDLEYQLVRDAFFLDVSHPVVKTFQAAYGATAGRSLPTGSKPFVDDGNLFWAKAKIPAITHGPRAGGQHTTSEWVDIDDLVRVAHLYAVTAAVFCTAE
jgi:acetylornithine deacetylase/succinyl-diaminopimelate desuccinylase-like protein